jgi:hypothetical protein
MIGWTPPMEIGISQLLLVTDGFNIPDREIRLTVMG